MLERWLLEIKPAQGQVVNTMQEMAQRVIVEKSIKESGGRAWGASATCYGALRKAPIFPQKIQRHLQLKPLISLAWIQSPSFHASHMGILYRSPGMQHRCQ